jgi:tetratricopeptide (TPR) repeat protein
MSSFKSVVVKLLIVCALLAAAGFYIVDNQLHEIDFRAVFSSGRGSPITRLADAVKLQREKTELLGEGRGQLLGGEYEEAFKTAMAVKKLDAGDLRVRALIADTTNAVVEAARQEFESGKIEDALVDVRLALGYKADHAGANKLYMDIADRLLLEAQAHYNKKEYSKLIAKAQEVIKIDPSNMTASNLLVRTNNELLSEAEELYVSRRYFESLNMIRLSLRIDGTNPRALGWLNQISTFVETPKLELRGIITSGGTHYARILLPDSGKVVIVKKGGKVGNFKVTEIDATEKRVELLQIYTGEKFTIQQASAG